MAKQASLTMSNDEVEFVQNVENYEEAVETTENLQMDQEPATQYVLEVEPVEEPRKKNKGKGKSSNLSVTKKRISSHGLIKWLRTIWIADTTLKIMKPWLKAVNDESLKSKNQKMFLMGQAISQIMKQFFMWMKENHKSLVECSYASFEEWYLGDGLSMMSGKLPEMDWEDAFTSKLFDLYSDCIMELRRRQEDTQSESEAEQPAQKTKTTSKVFSSSRPTKNICMSSTIVRIPDPLADACTYKESENLQSTMKSRKRAHDGQVPKSVSWMKEKSPSRKLNTTTESESEEEDYHPGQLFKQNAHQKSVEEMSEPELTEPSPKRMKQQRRRLSNSSSDSEAMPDEEAFTSMVDGLARAHSLTPSTGRISQNILIKDGDGFISFTSPGERGSMIIKLEMYPFKDCVRLEKNQFWTKRIFSSTAVVCSKKSAAAYKTAMKLRELLTQQVGETKGVKIEKKAQTGWRRT